ncbi:MAG: DUF2306 domain-containing protein [Paracoccaceae bacterium]
MFRLFSRPIPLVLALAALTAIPVLVALIRVVEVALGSYPAESARLAVAPVAWVAHALAGAAFGIAGPVQFALALRRRFGALHRASGRIFVVSGAVLGLSSLSLLAQVLVQSTDLLALARGVFGLALLAALAISVTAILDRDVPRHRAWAVRAYAIGMGSGTVWIPLLPVTLITGTELTGLPMDLVFVAWWVLTIAVAEAILRQPLRSTARVPA